MHNLIKLEKCNYRFGIEINQSIIHKSKRELNTLKLSFLLEEFINLSLQNNKEEFIDLSLCNNYKSDIEKKLG